MSSFSPIGQNGIESENEGSFWPSFTDIMMVVVLIFLMATSLLIVRNWNLVSELQQSIEAERLAAQMIESTTQENATLEERLINAEQLNSILRLRILEKDEQLQAAQRRDIEQQQQITQLETAKARVDQLLAQIRTELGDAQSTIGELNAESAELMTRLAQLKSELQKQQQLTQATQLELELATAEIAALTATTEEQKQDIALLEQEKIEYNRELLTLKGDYEVVKSKYEQLIKPARSAKGKYVAEVYYVKDEKGKIIRFKEPGDSGFRNLSLPKVEARLAELKKEKGQQLYIKIIIPQDSGLSYSEAWGFMKSLLQKYDYYYQPENPDKPVDISE